LGGAAGAGVDQLTGGEGGEDKDEGKVGFEATIASNTTSSLAAEGGNLDRARKGGLYSLKACTLRGCDL
jgi:hypothetical protein